MKIKFINPPLPGKCRKVLILTCFAMLIFDNWRDKDGMSRIEQCVAIDENHTGAHSHFRPLTIRPVLPITGGKKISLLVCTEFSRCGKKKRKVKGGTNVGADVHLATRQACRKAIAVMSSEIEYGHLRASARTFHRYGNDLPRSYNDLGGHSNGDAGQSE